MKQTKISVYKMSIRNTSDNFLVGKILLVNWLNKTNNKPLY